MVERMVRESFNGKELQDEGQNLQSAALSKDCFSSRHSKEVFRVKKPRQADLIPVPSDQFGWPEPQGTSYQNYRHALNGLLLDGRDEAFGRAVLRFGSGVRTYVSDRPMTCRKGVGVSQSYIRQGAWCRRLRYSLYANPRDLTRDRLNTGWDLRSRLGDHLNGIRAYA
jgi:hypothetical protein